MDTQDSDRNYLKRSVVKPEELNMVKGGEKIDLLSSQAVYAASH